MEFCNIDLSRSSANGDCVCNCGFKNLKGLETVHANFLFTVLTLRNSLIVHPEKGFSCVVRIYVTHLMNLPKSLF